MNSDNVKIPTELFERTLNVLEYIYKFDGIVNFAPDFMAYFESALWDLWRKQHSRELRSAYAAIVAARTDSERDIARIRYLRLKEELANTF